MFYSTYGSLNDIYSDSSNKLLLVSTSAGWCSACIEEQPALEQLHQDYAGEGLVVMVTLFEDLEYQAVDGSYAQAWKDRYNLSFVVVADREFVFKDYYNTDATPMFMTVEIPTMTILRIETGFDSGAVTSIIEAKL